MEEQSNDDIEQPSEPAKKKKLFNKWQQELLDSPHAKTIIEFAKNLKRKDELKKAEEEGKLTEVFYLMKTHPSSTIKFQEEKEELEKVSNTIDAIAKTKSFIKNVRTL